ncbi:hypothetical protein [Bacteriovorax sp. Seq25_V]|uniref:hypothetical protein n=1 Tax=Bacteriovorax sp. Seq25_V TaxID=1201288 RepID=UPI00038A1B63|nr:hypothetical protein [Bacteriovorax sp. Seq25_V]EQC44199.1 hypothetical protein M900_A0364 [Bacteriovorax sp. Seq25_V]
MSKYFPEAEYRRYKGGRGCIAGQGELKKLRFDPLFTLNHTCAMFRSNINRLASEKKLVHNKENRHASKACRYFYKLL